MHCFLFQISLEVGDVLGVAGNHWNGFNKGRNHRTNRWVSNASTPSGSLWWIFSQPNLTPFYNSGLACIRSTKRRKNYELSIFQNMRLSKHRDWQWREKDSSSGEEDHLQNGCSSDLSKEKMTQVISKSEVMMQTSHKNKENWAIWKSVSNAMLWKTYSFLLFLWGVFVCLLGNWWCGIGNWNFAPLYLAFLTHIWT